MAEAEFTVLPENARILDTLAWIVLQNNKSQLDKSLLVKSSSLSPSVAIILCHTGTVLASTNDREASKIYLQKGFELDPDALWVDDARNTLNSP